MQSTKGLQQTRTRLTRSHLECGTGFTLRDPHSHKPLMELTTDLFAPGHGYVALQLFTEHDILYRLWLSDELLNSEVTPDKLIKLFINKLAMETHLAVRLSAIDTRIDVEPDLDEENVVLLWLGNVCIAEFVVYEEEGQVDIYTDLQGSMVKIQVADIFRRVQQLNDAEKNAE
jgi:hypothetical protein